MKRIILLFLILLGLSQAANYSSRTFDQFGEDFHWNMTVEDAEDYIKKHQPVIAEVETSFGEYYTIVSDDYYIFRFNTSGKLEFVKLKVEADDRLLDTLIEQYGDYDKADDIADQPNYFWHGTMGGEYTQMVLFCASVSDYYYIEFYPIN